MKFTILDLEWNGTYCAKEDCFINEIIQFGAVKTDENFAVIDTMDVFVKPQIGKKLNGKVEQLTNISISDLEDGVSFTKALWRFREMVKGSVLLTWGTCDIRALVENYRYYAGEAAVPLQGQYVDLQLYCQTMLQQPLSQQMGLITAAELLQISYQDMALHRAIDDSLLSLKCFEALYDKEALAGFVQECDTEFYERIMFKNTIVTDLNHPMIDKKQMVFQCPSCGKRIRRMSKWALKNKQFTARFTCGDCGGQFLGRIQYKLKYDGMQTKKHIAPFVETPEPEKEKQNVKTQA